MTKPENFILNTDYAAPKNDDSGTFSITVPSNISVPAAGISLIETKQIGSAGANLRARMSSTKDGNRWFCVPTVYYDRTGSMGGYFLFATVHRISATELRFTVFIPNPYGSTMTGAAGSETINVVVNTFIPPFS